MKTEKSREERFDDVFQIVLIVVALSFDIPWFFGRIPIAETGVFVFILVIWAFGHLKGGETEYAFKLGSFNQAILLLTNFYTLALTGTQDLPLFFDITSILVFSIICISISATLYSYLRGSADRETSIGILVGGTVGYVAAMLIVAFIGLV